MFNADSKNKRNSALELIEIFVVRKIKLSPNAFGDVFVLSIFSKVETAGCSHRKSQGVIWSLSESLDVP